MALMGVVLLVNLPGFRSGFLPVHDTLKVFEGYHIFYNHFFQFGELPHWNWYAGFGAPNGYWQLAAVSAIGYGTGLLGWLGGVQDVLLICKTTILLEQAVFIAGLYLLGRLIYDRPSTAFFLCIVAILTCVWQLQVYWNFRFYAPFPLAVAWLVLFRRRRNGLYFWLSGLTFLGGLPGSMSYFVIPWLLVLATMTPLLFGDKLRDWPELLRWRTGALPMLLLLIGCFAAYFSFLKVSTAGLTGSVAGRDPVTLRNSLQTFLVYGGAFDAAMFMKMLLCGHPITTEWSGRPDITAYMGILPLGMYCWGLWHVRSRIFLAFAFASVALSLLACGGLVSMILYKIPGFCYFRHIALTFGLWHVLALICAGYGWEDFTRRGTMRDLLVGASAVFVLTEFFAERYSMYGFATGRTTPGNVFHVSHATPEWLQQVQAIVSPGSEYAFVYRWWVYLVALAIMWLHARRATIANDGWRHLLRRRLGTFALNTLLAAALVDAASFQWQVATWDIFEVPEERLADLDTFDTHPVEYCPGRSPEQPLSPRAVRVLMLEQCRKLFMVSEVTLGFAMLDVYRPAVPAEFTTQRCATILNSAPSSGAFVDMIGVSRPKLRLFRSAILCDTDDQADILLRSAEYTGDAPIIRTDGQAVRQESIREADAAVGTAQVTSFGSNHCAIDVDVAGGSAWLVYADCIHPGWTATVDGRPVPIYAANLAFKAVQLEPGHHAVEFRYGGWGPWLGNLVALLCVIGSVAMMALVVAMCLFRLDLRNDSTEADETP